MKLVHGPGRGIMKGYSLMGGQNFIIWITKMNRQAEPQKYWVDVNCC